MGKTTISKAGKLDRFARQGCKGRKTFAALTFLPELKSNHFLAAPIRIVSSLDCTDFSLSL